jgi:hypothetical protein
MKIHTVRLIDRRWATARGLSVGDTVSQLKKRYPSQSKRSRSLAGTPAATGLRHGT